MALAFCTLSTTLTREKAMEKEIECSQDNCKEIAAFEFYWMSEKKYCCVLHVDQVINIGRALGMNVQPRMLAEFDPINDNNFPNGANQK